MYKNFSKYINTIYKMYKYFNIKCSTSKTLISQHNTE